MTIEIEDPEDKCQLMQVINIYVHWREKFTNAYNFEVRIVDCIYIP